MFFKTRKQRGGRRIKLSPRKKARTLATKKKLAGIRRSQKKVDSINKKLATSQKQLDKATQKYNKLENDLKEANAQLYLYQSDLKYSDLHSTPSPSPRRSYSKFGCSSC